MYTFCYHKQSYTINSAPKIPLIPSKHDINLYHYEVLGSHWLLYFKTLLLLEVYPLSESIDLSTDPCLMSHLTTCTCLERTPASPKTFHN
jgi:hypothetical protein